MTFEDELHNKLHAAGEDIEVINAGAAAVQRRAASRGNRTRALGGLGAFALFAGALGGTYIATRDTTERIDVAVSVSTTGAAATEALSGSDSADGDFSAESSLAPPGIAEPINYGVLPIDWEVLGEPDRSGIFNVQVSGDRFYGQGRDGWIWVSDDFLSWAPLPVPSSLADAEGDLNGWVNTFDANSGVIAIAVEMRGGNRSLEPVLGSTSDADGPIGTDPCGAGYEQPSTTVVISADGGVTWVSSPLVSADLPSPRFQGGSAAISTATDGSSVLVAVEQYSDINMQCVLSEAGVDVDDINSSGGWYSWDDTGVQVYEGFDAAELDGTESDSELDSAIEGQIAATYSWDELGLTDAEVAAVTGAGDREGAALIRLDLDGNQTPLDRVDGNASQIIGLDDEYLLAVYDDSGQRYLRSSDRGAIWTEAEIDGFLRTDVPGALLLQDNNGSDISVSTDGGRTWTDLGSPKGHWIESIAVLGDTALASGARSVEYGDVVEYREDDVVVGEPYEASASVNGFTVTVNTGSETLAITIVDETSGETIVDREADFAEFIEAGESGGTEWMEIADGTVTFLADDGSVIVQFLESDLDEAFEGAGTVSSGGGASSGSFAQESVEAVPTTFPVDTRSSLAPSTTVESSADVDLPAGVDLPADVDLPAGDATTPATTTVVTSDVISGEPEPCPDDGECGAVFDPGVVLSYRSPDGVWVSQPLSEIVPDGGWVQSITTVDGVFYLLIEPIYDEIAGEQFEDDSDEVDTRFETNPIVVVGRPITQ